MHISNFGYLSQVLFGILLLFYVPDLDPYPGYIPIGNEVPIDEIEYEQLPDGEQICPERQANLFSSKFILIKELQELYYRLFDYIWEVIYHAWQIFKVSAS